MVKWRRFGLWPQLLAVTVLAAAALAWLTSRVDDPAEIWLTPDQRGQLAFDAVEYVRAAELFEDPMWQGTALYKNGKYEEAAGVYARIAHPVGFYNRGNSLTRAFEYVKAARSFELAVAEAPDWTEARENLELALYIQQYIMDAREQGDTGDESEIGADDYRFDNTEERGREMEITQQSTIELESAEKWMRSVNTETRDFLRTRFDLEQSTRGRQ